MAIPDWLTIDPLVGKKTTEVANTSIVHTGRLSRLYSVQVDVLKLKAGIQSYEVEQLPLAAFVSLNSSDSSITFSPESTALIGQSGVSNSSSITATLGSALLRWANFAVNGTEVVNDPIPDDPGAVAQFEYTFNVGLAAEYKGGLVRSGAITLTGVDGATATRDWTLPIQHLVSPTTGYRPAQNWNNTDRLSFPFLANVSSLTFSHQDAFALVRWGAATTISPVDGLYTITIPEADYADARWSKNLFITLTDNTDQNAREITIPITFNWSDGTSSVVTYLADQYGHATKTEYTNWSYNISIGVGYRTRTATQYEGNRLPDGSVPTWTEVSSDMQREDGTLSTANVGFSNWSYTINTSEGYRTRTYVTRYTWTFSDGESRYADSGTQTQREDASRSIGAWSYAWAYPVANSTRSTTVTYTFSDTTRTTPLTESGGGSYSFPALSWIDLGGYTPANGGHSGVRMTATTQLSWAGVGVISQGDVRVIWTSVDNGFQIGDPAIGWGADGLFRLINNTSTSVIFGNANGYSSLAGVNWPLPTQVVRQSAGAKVYGGWVNISMVFYQSAFPASGGSTPSTVTCHNTWTWNGVAGSGGTDSTTTNTLSGASTNLGSIISGSVLLVPSLGTTTKGATTGTVTTATNLAGNYISANFTQAENREYREYTQFAGCSNPYSLYNVYGQFSSGDSYYKRQESQLIDGQCGYVAPHYQVSTHLVTDWNTVRQIVGADEVRVEFDCGYAPFATQKTIYGYWTASNADTTDNTEDYNYWWGGAQGNSGGNFMWAGPAFVSISNRSGGLAQFKAEIAVTDPNADSLVLSARY